MDKNLLSAAYNPEVFSKEGHELIDMLTAYLTDSLEAKRPANNWKEPEDQLKYWMEDLKNGNDDLGTLFKNIIDNSLHMHNRRNLGHQVAVPAPEAALAGLLGELLNNGTVVYEIGSAAVALERVIVKLLAQKFGFDDNADGFMTSGASLSNLTCLLAARSVKAQDDVWEHGNKGHQYAVMVSEEAHYCVEKAARIMGWGTDGVIKIPVDADYRMRCDLLEEYYQKAVAEGIEVIAVVGCACSTSTGIYDDLNTVADFAQRHNLWFHVDAAHGGPAIFSEKYNHLLAGVERADSVVMDFHKMMMTPAITTAIVFRDGASSYQTFSHKAQYLWEEPKDAEWYNLGQRTFECTKLMMSIKVYVLLKKYGTGIFTQYVEQTYGLGEKFADMVRETPHVELALQPQTNVVCFRYRPDAECTKDELTRINSEIRHRILEKGDYYMVQTRLKDEIWLRVSIMNAFTTVDDLSQLLDIICQYGREISGR